MNILIIRHRLSCTLHILKQNKPHIYIKNKSLPVLLGGIRPFIFSFNSKLSALHKERAYSNFSFSQFLVVRGAHNGKDNYTNLTPVLSFANADIQKPEILKEIKGKAGVYR